MLSKLIMFIVICALLFNCDQQNQKVKATKPDAKKRLKNGLIVTNDDNGKLSTNVNYLNGLKNGISTSFYENGNKKLEMNYIKGKREGKSYKYFENGQLYAETPYSDNQINGIRKTYYRSGGLKADTPYANNLMGTGTVEYDKKGEILPEYELVVKRKNKDSFSVSSSKACKKVIYYMGALVNNQFLNEKKLLPLSMYGDNGEFELEGFEKKLNFICRCNTPLGNVVIFQKEVRVN